jgi:hypothetical protein
MRFRYQVYSVLRCAVSEPSAMVGKSLRLKGLTLVFPALLCPVALYEAK